MALKPMPDQPSHSVPSDFDSSVSTTPAAAGVPARPKEIGGRQGPEPTRYGDWEKDGRCIDF